MIFSQNIITENGSRLSELECAYQTISKELVKFKTQVDLKRSTIQDEKKNHEATVESIKELESTLAQTRIEIENLCNSFEKERVEHEDNVLLLKSQEDLLNTLTMGISAQGEDHGFVSQLQGCIGILSVSNE